MSFSTKRHPFLRVQSEDPNERGCADFCLVGDYPSHSFLGRPFSESASIGLIAVPLVDVVRACIAIAEYDTLSLINPRSVCKTPSRHAFRIQGSGQIEMVCRTQELFRVGALLESLVAKAEYSSIGLMCWHTLHRYADTQSNFYHECGWRRVMSAAATLKRVFSAFFSSAYFETL
jgi:hypothetical protein